MINNVLIRLGLREPNGARLLHRELSAIELQLAYRNQHIVRLYDEMDMLRDNREEVRMKLDQWAERKPRSFRIASAESARTV